MRKFLDAVPAWAWLLLVGVTVLVGYLAAIPVWAWLVLLGILVVAGYTIRSFGFGTRTLKTITTVEDVDSAASPKKRSITTEEEADKTFWDWMTLLTISAVIAIVALQFTRSQAEEQRYIQQQEAMEASLQAYLDQMTQMMLDDETPLLKSESKSAEAVMARVRTVTTLRRLDARRNKLVLSLLRESGLLGFSVPDEPKVGVVRLDDADLTSTDLAGANLSGLNLRHAKLSHAQLDNAGLGITNLTFAGLERANLEGADLRDADLLFADLSHANLTDANFSGASLDYADLSGADLTSAENLTKDQIALTQGDSKTQLPEDGPPRPSRWSKSDADIWGDSWSRLGVSLVSVKTTKAEDFNDEIGIPGDVGKLKKGGRFGTLVSDVKPGSVADGAGFQSGDIILYVGTIVSKGRFKGRPVLGRKNMNGILDQQYQPGSQVHFIIKRWYFQEGWKKGRLEGKIVN